MINRAVRLFFLVGGLFALQCSAETFKNPKRLVLPETPGLLTHGDVNGDGLDDLVYSDGNAPRYIHTLLGTSTGEYRIGPVLTLPSLVGYSCVLQDMNHDQKLDLACPYETTTHASIAFFAGNGDGSFAAPLYTPLPDTRFNNTAFMFHPTGDLNGDGVPDLLASDEANDGVMFSVLSDGKGGFKVAQKFYMILPTFVDLNGDGKIDAISSGGNFMLGLGDGTFGPLQQGALPPSTPCAFGDVDGDNQVDEVCNMNDVSVYSLGPWDIEVFHGNGDGTFNLTPIYKGVFSKPLDRADNFGEIGIPMLVKDIDGDGYPDIVTLSADGTTIFYGGPGLTFSEPKHFVTDSYESNGMVGPLLGMQGFVADMNGDGLLDFVAPGFHSIEFTYGQRNSLQTAPAYVMNRTISNAGVADFNGDGVPDVVTIGYDALTIALGKGDGSFLPYTQIQPDAAYSSGLYDHITPATILHGDFNGDGKEDLLAQGGSDIDGSKSPAFYFGGVGDGTFSLATQIIWPYIIPFRSATAKVADVNGDGRADLLNPPDTTSALLHVMLSTGPGSFTLVDSPVPVELYYNREPIPETTPAVADFDGDGNLDLVIAAQNYAYVMKGAGDGSFNLLTKLDLPPLFKVPSPNGRGLDVAAGDFDGDGHKDIAVLWGDSLDDFTGFARTETIIFYGKGDGTFLSPVIAETGLNGYVTIKAADVNRDGRDEILLRGSGHFQRGTNIGVLHGLANRTFMPEVNYSAGVGLSPPEIADLNADGFPDLVFANGDYNGLANSVTVLINQGNIPQVFGTISASPEPSTAGSDFDLTAVLESSDSSALTGPVTFLLDGVLVGSANLANNRATIAVQTHPSVGSHAIEADWAGNSKFPAASIIGTHQVTRLPTSLALTNTPPSTVVGSPLALAYQLSGTGSVSPTGSITITDNGAPFDVVQLTGTAFPVKGQDSSSTLTVGSHTMVATYSGDATYAGSTATVTQTVQALPTTMALVAAPGTINVGAQVRLAATLSSPAACGFCSFSGSVVFSDGENLLGTGTVHSDGTATLLASLASAGTHTLSASFSGDLFHQAANATASELVVRSDSTLALASSKNPSAAGEGVTLTATARIALSGAPVPTGTVTFFREGAVPLGSVAVDAQGKVSLAVNSLSAGTHGFSATLAENDSFNASYAALSQVVTLAPTATTLAASPNPVYQGRPIELTARVNAVNGLVPGGPVAFQESGKLLGSAALSNGTAALRLSTLSVGDHEVNAVYAGDSNNSESISLNVRVTVLPSDFQLAGQPTALELKTGHHLTFTLTATSTGNFADSLDLSAEGLPAHMTVQFTPTRAPLSAGGTAGVSVYLDTDDILGYESSVRGSKIPVLLCLMAPLTLLWGRRRRPLARLLLALFCFAALMQTTGCSGKLPASVAPGSYILTLAAKGVTTGVTHSISVPVEITQ